MLGATLRLAIEGDLPAESPQGSQGRRGGTEWGRGKGSNNGMRGGETKEALPMGLSRRQTEKIERLESEIKAGGELLLEMKGEKEEADELLERYRAESQKLRRAVGYRKSRQGVANQTVKINTREVGLENRSQVNTDLRHLLQVMLSKNVSIENAIPLINQVLTFSAVSQGAKSIRLLKPPSVSTVSNIQLEMGHLTEFRLSKDWLDGRARNVNLSSDGTTKGGVDFQAVGMDVLNEQNETVRFLVGWKSLANHTVAEQVKEHEVMFERLRWACLAIDPEAAQQIARMSLDSDIIVATMGDHASDQKAKTKELQFRSEDPLLEWKARAARGAAPRLSSDWSGGCLGAVRPTGVHDRRVGKPPGSPPVGRTSPRQPPDQWDIPQAAPRSVGKP
ncbi:hypothetical protein KFL_012760030, partial [Klebsormidium nitens]